MDKLRSDIKKMEENYKQAISKVRADLEQKIEVSCKVTLEQMQRILDDINSVKKEQKNAMENTKISFKELDQKYAKKFQTRSTLDYIPERKQV